MQTILMILKRTIGRPARPHLLQITYTRPDLGIERIVREALQDLLDLVVVRVALVVPLVRHHLLDLRDLLDLLDLKDLLDQRALKVLKDLRDLGDLEKPQLPRMLLLSPVSLVTYKRLLLMQLWSP